MWADGHHVVAGAVAGLTLPLTVFALNLPFPAAVGIAGALYLGIVLILAPRRMTDRIKLGEIGRAQGELVASLIEDGEKNVMRLREASRGLRTEAAAQTAFHLAEVAHGILERLAAEPAKLPVVRRFLTYYLPRSAEIAEGLGIVERQQIPDAKRQAEIGTVLAKLDQAFTFYADSFAQAELDTLDVELKLIGRALSDDLGPSRVEPQLPTKRGS